MSIDCCAEEASSREDEEDNRSNDSQPLRPEGNDDQEQLDDRQEVLSDDSVSTLVQCKIGDFDDENDETTATTKFLAGNLKTVIVPKISKTTCLNIHTKTRSNKNEAEVQLSEKENELISERRKIKKGVPWKIFTIYTIDSVIAAVIVGPMVVAHWRGIWILMDSYENIFTGWACFGVGLSLHFFFAVAKYPLHKFFAAGIKSRGLCSRFALKIIRTLYLYAFSVACNSHWRGIWIILNDWFGEQGIVIGCFTCAVLGDLLAMRCARNLLAPPFLLLPDSPRFVFRFPTKYKANSRDWSLYILDCAFSVGVVGTLVVFVWRGVWALLDLYLFPGSRENSAIGSLIIGYIIVVVSFSLQPLMRYVCSRLQGLARLCAADAFLLLSFFGTVNVWRGIWMALDLYLFPGDLKLSCWITHFGCFVFLVLLNCSNSVLVRGVYIDAEEQSGKCVAFPIHYLRQFFKVEREKQEARRRNLVVASKDLGDCKDAENGALLSPGVRPVVQPANPESLV